MKFFSLNKTALAAKIFSALKISTENDKYLTIDTFSDGEILPIFRQSVRNQEIFIIADGNTPDDIMKLFLTVDGAKRSGAEEINVIYPFKFTPISNYLFERLLRKIGVKKLLTTEVDNNGINGFYNVPFGEKTNSVISEYINLFDKNLDIQGELFYSLNKTKLSDSIFNAIQYYSGTDEFLSITQTDEGTYAPLFRNNLKDKDVFICADGHHSADIMKLLATVNKAKRLGARKITVIYPYAPYSRQDKNDHVRSSIGAKLLADILQAAGTTQMITIELHAGAIQGFYNIPIVHLNGNRVCTDYMLSLGLSDLTFTAPDHGASKRNQDFAKRFTDYTNAIIDKRRLKPNEVASMELIGHVKGRNVVFVDDLGDTLGTVCKASDLVKSEGALSTRAVLVHFVASGNALTTLANSSLDEIIVSDTVVGVYEKAELYNKIDVPTKPRLTIISSANLLAVSIDRLIKHESINELNLA